MTTKREILAICGITLILGCSFDSDSNDIPSPEMKWKFETGDRVMSSPLLVDGVLLLGSNDTNFYAINSETGSLEWTYSTEGWVKSTPAIYDDLVFFGSYDGYVYAVNLDGELEWRFDNNRSVGADMTVSGDGILYFGTHSGRFFALEAPSREVIWDKDVPWRRTVAGAAILGDTLYIGGDGDTFNAFDRFTGEDVWSFPIQRKVLGEATVDGERVYFGTADLDGGMFYALDAEDGSVVWEKEPVGGVPVKPALWNDLIIFGDYQGRYYALDSASGEEVWRTRAVSGTMHMDPIVVDDVLYTGESGGYLRAFDVETGNILWKFKTYNAVQSTPAVTEEHIFFGSNDSNVYALHRDSK